MSPLQIVETQVDAYNRRDLAAFVALYSDDVEVFRLPSTTPGLSGKAAFTEFYRTERFNRPDLHAEIVNRIVLGNKVIDHERITGVQDTPMEIAAVYEVAGDRIERVWFFPTD
jgi:hypothetical protein